MELPIVVGVDGSEPSLRAVDWAADKAALRGVPLRVVYASLWERYERAVFAEGPARSEQILTDVLVEAAAKRARQRAPDVKISTEVVPQGPVPVLVREARDASALVLGSRGHGGGAELLLGSVSQAVAAHADCPVIVVRGGHDNQAKSGAQGPIIVGVPEKPADSAAVRFAFREAAEHAVPLEAVRAWHCPAHESVDHPLLTGEPAHVHRQRAVEVLETGLRASIEEYPAVEVHRRTVEGRARTVLLDASADADLLVVGAIRPHGRFGLQIGRVTHAVLHHAACPVAVVPEQA